MTTTEIIVRAKVVADECQMYLLPVEDATAEEEHALAALEECTKAEIKSAERRGRRDWEFERNLALQLIGSVSKCIAELRERISKLPPQLSARDETDIDAFDCARWAIDISMEIDRLPRLLGFDIVRRSRDRRIKEQGDDIPFLPPLPNNCYLDDFPAPSVPVRPVGTSPTPWFDKGKAFKLIKIISKDVAGLKGYWKSSIRTIRGGRDRFERRRMRAMADDLSQGLQRVRELLGAKRSWFPPS